MPTHYLAVDIGASSGRHILGWLDDGVIRLEEIHRFENGMVEKNGFKQWDVDHLVAEIVAGLRRAGERGTRPVSMGIDTWGVDYVLLDRDDKMVGPPVAYRDARTEGVIPKVYDIIAEEELYARTGIQKLLFNTVFQLYAVRQDHPEWLDRAESMLMMPSYLGYRLTGVKANEYTHASTGQLLDAEKREWDWQLIDTLGFPRRIFSALHMPGEKVGPLAASIRDAVGYDLDVVLPPTHDTASAVLALPDPTADAIYLSSGTWSLMGIELASPDCRDACRRKSFTNEGGYGRTIRFLKNIMGLWIIQNLRKELAPGKSFADLTAMAEQGMDFGSIIDVNHPSLFAPKSMAQALRDCCREACGSTPADANQLLACAYNSLAKSYADTVEEIEGLSGRTFDRIYIMGGGSQDRLLNSLTARYTQKEVHAGPVEATAIGNILSQMLRDDAFPDVASARAAVRDSFAITKISQ